MVIAVTATSAGSRTWIDELQTITTEVNSRQGVVQAGAEAWVGDCPRSDAFVSGRYAGTVKDVGDEMGTDETLTTIGTQPLPRLSRRVTMNVSPASRRRMMSPLNCERADCRGHDSTSHVVLRSESARCPDACPSPVGPRPNIYRPDTTIQSAVNQYAAGRLHPIPPARHPYRRPHHGTNGGTRRVGHHRRSRAPSEEHACPSTGRNSSETTLVRELE